MQITPAKCEYVRQGLDGKVAVITQDSQAVAESLRRHDPCLQLWYLEDVTGDGKSPPVYAVFRVHINDRPCSVEEMKATGQDPEFVLSAMECDQRIFHRILEIDSRGRGGYDYVAEVEKNHAQVEQRWHDRVRESTEETAEQLAHAMRYDLGYRYRGRATPHRFGRPGYTAKS